MKSTIISISAALLSGLISFAPAAAQEKKSEQKIKIVIADGSGEKVVIDTVMNDKMSIDTLRLKDGNMVFIGHAGDESMMNHAAGPGHMIVTVSDEDKDSKKVVKEITVVSSDSAHMEMSRNEGASKVYVITSSNSAGNKKGDNFSYHISSDKMLSDSEKTKYVISKDGMVITVEGSDYDKVKALVKDIEAKLEIDKDKNSKKK